MDVFLWMNASFIIIGCAVLIMMKRKLDHNKNPSVQASIWLIAGTAVWGTVSILLIVWSFHKIW